MEYYNKHRPRTLADVEGQDDAVRALKKYEEKGKFPHVLLFSGPTGCGKTTLARIIRKILDCHKSCFKEVNCADFNGIETVRNIRTYVNHNATGGSSRIWLIDEAHMLTKDAQNAFLKILEDPPSHVYFFICTTDEDKLIGAFRGRCAPIHVKLMSHKALTKVINSVAEAEEIDVTEDVVDKIIEACEGSARLALQILQKISGCDDEAQMLASITISRNQKEAIGEVFKHLMDSRTQWGDMIKVLKAVKEEPEKVRHYVMACCRNVMLGGGKGAGRAWMIADAFRHHWYDCKEIGLVSACYEIVVPPKR